MKPRDILIHLAVKFKGNWDEIYRSIKTHKNYEDEQEVLDTCRNLKCNVITIMDEEYPENLKKVYKPPFVLFYMGDMLLIQNSNRSIAVIGSRQPKEYSVNHTTTLVSGLPKDVVVVSGLAYGIDSVAHRSAIDSHHKTVAVLGSGIDICYPSINKDLFDEISESHLLISEYPPGVEPNPSYFPARNRIIACLAKCVLVTEAKIKSGTMITVGVALTLGRDVLCLPSEDLGNSGTNLCIKNGAFLVETCDDVNQFFA